MRKLESKGTLKCVLREPDLGEEAAVVSGQNELDHIVEPLKTQHVCCKHHLTVEEETKIQVSLFFRACVLNTDRLFKRSTWDLLGGADPRWPRT